MASYDIVIVGGGPAGLTAALYCARAGKSVCILERNITGGQIVYAPLVENYPGLPGMSGQSFADALTSQVEALGVEIAYEEALSVLPAKGTAETKVVTDCGEYTCRAVIIAAGTSHRTLGLENEDELVGAGISYCAICDGAFYKDKKVCVIGGGNTALQEAIFLSDLCREVTLIHRRDAFRADAALVERFKAKGSARMLLDTTVKSLITKDGSVCGIVTDTKGKTEEHETDCLFVAVGNTPNTAPFDVLGITGDSGFFKSTESGKTAYPDVFVAGDCREKAVRQLTTACADGANAATGACEYVDSLKA